MDSTGLFNYNGIKAEVAHKGLFTATDFKEVDYKNGKFGNYGANNSAEFEYDSGIDGIKLYQQWVEMGVATIKLTSFLKKLSDTPTEVDFNTLMFSRSHHDGSERDADYLRKGFNDKAKPTTEPDFDEGVLKHN